MVMNIIFNRKVSVVA